jgi:hypothetical protein
VLPGLSVGSLEHLVLPRTRPWVREVGVYVGGPRSETAARVAGAVVGGARSIPGLPSLVRWTAALPRVNESPDDDALAQAQATVVASAYDADDRLLASERFTGGDPYSFTALMLSWAARRLAAGAAGQSPGVLSPVEAFGLQALAEASADAGLGADVETED